jgi:hypothetical protein
LKKTRRKTYKKLIIALYGNSTKTYRNITADLGR